MWQHSSNTLVVAVAKLKRSPYSYVIFNGSKHVMFTVPTSVQEETKKFNYSLDQALERVMLT